MKIPKCFLNIENIEIKIDESHYANGEINSPKIEKLMRLRSINIDNIGDNIIDMKVKGNIHLSHMIIIIPNNMIIPLIQSLILY